MKRKLLLNLVFIFFLYPILNAQGYEIKVEINGVSDTVIYLGYHSGSKKLVSDTTYIDKKGRAVFKGDNDLQRGIYLIVMPSRGMMYFEMLIADSQKFSIKTDTTNFVENIEVKGSPENVVFNLYQRRLGELQKERLRLNTEIEEHSEDEEKVEELRNELRQLNDERLAYMNEIVEKHPDYFFSTILRAMMDIEIPDPPTDEDGKEIDPDFRYNYLKKHYFDNIDFSERGLLRTPIFENKIEQYFEHMVIPKPDSLIVETDRVIGMAYEAGDSLVFRATTAQLLRYFETSRIMGYDAVFVHIAEKWYFSGKAFWASEEFMERLTERVMKISPTLIGNITPNLARMQTFDRQYISLHNVEADYTILVFWEPDCGHCRRLVPELLQKFKDTLQDINVKVFAMYTQYDREEWSKFLTEREIKAEGWYNVWDGPRPHSNFRDLYDIYSTPVVYVLAKDKRIVAKRVGVSDIPKIIEFDQKQQGKGEI